ncbi:small membrane protein, partial [Raoultella planticola]
ITFLIAYFDLFCFYSFILGWYMSGIIVLIVALLLLVIAAYNLVSYIRDRRQSGLPTKKSKR